MGVKFYNATTGKWHDATEAEKASTSQRALSFGGSAYVDGYPKSSVFSGSSFTSSYVSTTSTYEACKYQHTGEEELFNYNDLIIAAGEKQYIGEFGDDTLLVNLSGSAVNKPDMPAISPITSVPKKLELSGLANVELALQAYNPHHGDEMMIQWSDGGSPALKPEFWRQLLTEAVKAGYYRIIFMCFGGHGRTGTALAAVRIMLYNENTDDAVRWIRKHHCKKAVESASQVEYLDYVAEELNGWTRPKNVKPVEPSK